MHHTERGFIAHIERFLTLEKKMISTPFSRATGAASTQQVKVSMYHQNAASCSLLLALYRCLSVYSVNDEKPDIVFKQFSMR